MTRLPVCSGGAAIRAFERAGWNRARHRGSHVSLVKPGLPVVLTVPLHRELDRGLLRSLIRKAGLSVEEFTALLKAYNSLGAYYWPYGATGKGPMKRWRD